MRCDAAMQYLLHETSGNLVWTGCRIGIVYGLDSGLYASALGGAPSGYACILPGNALEAGTCSQTVRTGIPDPDGRNEEKRDIM